ncbi:MAG: cupredoxin domain-containing protein [Candidatus Roizmanbacteria bacterium]|nr:cupredoxin domain-containing protein [Candidatus Roizmanbacteria bacterium]
MDKIIVFIFGLLSILFTYWFFFMKKINTVQAEGTINILVDGGYKPERISIPYGQTTKLIFERKDSSACLEDVIIADFKVRKFLPLNEKTEIEINPNKKGEFDFSCGMGMFHGKLIVE